jgi:Ras-related protein Rab-5C
LLRNASPNIVIALVGNKLDLATHRQVTLEEGQAYADEANLLFTEASARSGDGVSEAFIKIAKKLPKTEQQMASPRLAPDARRVDLNRSGAESYPTTNRCC